MRKQTEKFVSVTGNGWPSHAKRQHANHAEYARKTLYAYMPCAGMRGTDYVDEVVRIHYGGSYARALRDFATDAFNLWCPRWIQRNYQVQNKDEIDPTVPPDPPKPEDASLTAATEEGEENETDKKKEAFPHAGRFPTKFLLEPEGEPTGEEDPERAEEHGTDYNWRAENRPSWQLHSECGPNPNAEGRSSGPVTPAPAEELVNPIEPSLPYDRHWETYDSNRVESMCERRATSTTMKRFTQIR